MTKCGRVTGLTLDTGALLALERGDSRVRACYGGPSKVASGSQCPLALWRNRGVAGPGRRVWLACSVILR